MTIKNKPLYRSGQFLILLGFLLLVADAGWHVLKDFGLMSFWLLLGVGVYLMHRASNGTMWRRKK